MQTLTHTLGLAATVLLTACPGPGPNETGDTDITQGPENVRSCDVTVRLSAADAVGADVVEVAGTFNDWVPAAMPADDAGDWALALGRLMPGVYPFKFVIDGVWQDPPPDVKTAWNGGFENRALYVADCTQPSLSLVTAGPQEADGLSALFRFTSASDGAPMDPETVHVTLGGQEISDLPVGAQVSVTTDVQDGTIEVLAGGLPDGKWSVRADAVDASGRPPEEGTVFAPVWTGRFDDPHAFNRGPMYFVFTDRFRDGGANLPVVAGTEFDGANYLGGDLIGARQALDEGWFDDLGVASIWLSPVVDNPAGIYEGTNGWHYAGYHGYWPAGERAVDEHWGDATHTGEEALHDFIDAAHARGLRVILDVPLNHVHQDHPWITAHPEWFTATPCTCTSNPGECNWDTNPLFCWFTDYLPDLDYRQPDLVTASLAETRWWLETFDADGLRIDAAKHMNHVILRSLSLDLKERYSAAVHGDIYLIGETFTSPGGQGLIMNYVAPYELDGQFDFPLLYPLRDAIGGQQGFRALAAEVRASDTAYGDAAQHMSVFMGNHDVPRYATDIAGCDNPSLFGGCTDVMARGDAIDGAQWDVINRLSMSFAFVATQPGPSLLYYGDEVGLAGLNDPDNRRLMPWSRSPAQDELLRRFQEIGQARHALRALQEGERSELWVDDTLYAYARATPDGDVAVVVMSVADAPRTQRIGLFGYSLLPDGPLVDALGSDRTAAVIDGAITVTLNPWEYAIFTPAQAQ